MRKSMVLLVAALALSLSVDAAMAGGKHCAGSASAGAACTGSKADKASMSGCTAGTEKASTAGMNCCPIDRASLDRQAPGSRAGFERLDNGVALVITAASAQYVSAVQIAVNNNYEQMKAQMTSLKSSCSMDKSSSTEKAAMTGSNCPMSTSKASQVSSGSACCAKGGASKAAMTEKSGAACSEKASAGVCSDISKAWCCADMSFEKTANGARIILTSTKPEVLKGLQAASDHMKSCPMMAGL